MAATASPAAPASGTTTRLSMRVDGMTCASCVAHVEQAITAVPGIQAVSVNLATERAEVTAGPEVDVAAVAHAIAEAGYSVPETQLDFAIEGMTCGSCVAHVEAAIAALPGVRSAAVNLATERASVRTLGGAPTADQIVAAVAAAGYQARSVAAAASGEGDSARRDEQQRLLARDVKIAVLLTLPLVVIEMGGHVVPAFHHWLAGSFGETALRLIAFVMTAAIMIGPGRRFYTTGLPALLRGTPDMNALVAIGTLAAFGYSMVATFAPRLLPAGTANVYFESAAVIVTLILLGRYLEAKSRGRTSAAIQRLLTLQPPVARVTRGGAAADVPVSEVVVDDRVLLRPGERVPVDGVVVEGASYVDQSMVTGEPMPVEKAVGAEVIAGTLNSTGSLLVRVTRIGADTLLARITRMVEDAQATKLPIQALVDRVTGYFVPAVMALALLTFLVWLLSGVANALPLALVSAISVLIIACPCAMGLATPTSIMVGTGRAAELGILFRRGDALQGLQGVTVVALDKTGTLTKGQPELTDIVTAPGFARAQALTHAAAVEALSEHPVSRAVLRAAAAEQLEVQKATDFRARAGFGVSGIVAGRRTHVGSARYMSELGVALGALEVVAADLAAQGKSPLFVAIDGQLAGLIAIADPIKTSARPAVDALRAMGLEIVMMTGDNRGTATAVARELGIDDVRPELLPADKLAAVRALQATGAAVAFVGDGINDAPVLAAADCGIAIGTGTDIAIESAEVVLMSDDLRRVAEAVALSKATMRNIGQNLFWAFAYNAALIPVAAGILYPRFGVLLSPMLAAGAMALSSVFVLTNALRLRYFATNDVTPTTANPSR